jgi:translation initiation factor 6 (eIF-6)
MYYRGGAIMTMMSKKLDKKENEAIENKIDVDIFDKAVAESNVSFTLEEAKKELGLL